MQSAPLQRGIAEFVGTFTLVFVGCGSIVAMQGSNLTVIALAHGLAIGVMASAVGHISGGHFNPAVTLGFMVTRRIEPRLAATYWFAQFIAAVARRVPLCGRAPSAGRGRGRPRRPRSRTWIGPGRGS